MSWQRRKTKYNKEVTNDYERTDVEVFLFIHLMHHKKATTWGWRLTIQIIQIILGMTYNNQNFCQLEWSLMFLAVHIFYLSTLGKAEPFSGHRTEHWWMIPFSSFHLFCTFEAVPPSKLIFIFLSFHLRCTLFGGGDISQWCQRILFCVKALAQILIRRIGDGLQLYLNVFLYSKTTVWCTRIKS